MKRINFFAQILPATFLFFVIVTSCANSANASPVSNYSLEDEESGKKTLSPYFVVISEHPETDRLPLKETSATVNIVGVMADVTIRQKYINNGKNTLEAVYTFPLSTKAAVYAMKMTIGQREITAKISKKEQARKDYTKARRQGKRVSLLEQNRPNVFTMSVANIAMRDTIVVELKYTELLVPENGIYSFVYPTVVGPRYSNKPKEGATQDDQFVNTPYTKEGDMPTYKFGFDMVVNAGMPIQNLTCNTHKINVKYPDYKTAIVGLAPSETEGGNRDLILSYSLKGNKIESGVMLYENGDENFFLMMIQPPKKVLEEEIPPREYIFIMDVSGSMGGFPITVSKKLLRNLILNLKPTDKFNVVLFAGYTGLLGEKSVDATEANIEKATQLIDNQRGGGGTELLKALKKAYSIPRVSTNCSRSFVLISDGFVDIEKEAFETVRNHNDNNNFFCFGIGSSVNRHLMEGIAFMGNGEPIIVENETKAEQAAEKFRTYISSPVLSQIKTNFGALQVYDIEPVSLPDMLAERPIVIFGKYRGKHDGIVTINGQTGHGTFEKTFDFSTIKPIKQFSAIRYLWARERIKLLDYYNSNDEYYHSGVNDLLKNEITQLGLKYGLMTQYTSFIAIDERFTVDKDKKRVKVKQPIPLPQGVSNLAIGELKSQEQINNTKGTVSIGSVMNGDDVNGKDIADLKEVVTQVQEEKTLDVVEQMPNYPGGDAAMMSFINQNLKYPVVAQENGIQGKVILRIQVLADGSIGKIEVLRSLDPACDKEAIRIVKSMPKWKPGIQNGKAVSVYYTIPISFKLE